MDKLIRVLTVFLMLVLVVALAGFLLFLAGSLLQVLHAHFGQTAVLIAMVLGALFLVACYLCDL